MSGSDPSNQRETEKFFRLWDLGLRVYSVTLQRLSIALSLVAIAAPFVLAYLLVTNEASKLKEYEQEKRLSLLRQIDAEVGRNLSLLQDSTAWHSIRPSFKYYWGRDGSLGILDRPWTAARFENDVWSVARGKDYFYSVDTTLVGETANLYVAFNQVNVLLERFTERRAFVRDMIARRGPIHQGSVEVVEIQTHLFDLETARVRIDSILNYIERHGPIVRRRLSDLPNVLK